MIWNTYFLYAQLHLFSYMTLDQRASGIKFERIVIIIIANLGKEVLNKIFDIVHC